MGQSRLFEPGRAVRSKTLFPGLFRATSPPPWPGASNRFHPSADGTDCSYICDIALHPEYHGLGLGKKIVQNLIDLSKGHKNVILYSNPGKEGFYAKLGFKKMNTAMISNGTISD